MEGSLRNPSNPFNDHSWRPFVRGVAVTSSSTFICSCHRAGQSKSRWDGSSSFSKHNRHTGSCVKSSKFRCLLLLQCPVKNLINLLRVFLPIIKYIYRNRVINNWKKDLGMPAWFQVSPFYFASIKDIRFDFILDRFRMGFCKNDRRVYLHDDLFLRIFFQQNMIYQVITSMYERDESILLIS